MVTSSSPLKDLNSQKNKPIQGHQNARMVWMMASNEITMTEVPVDHVNENVELATVGNQMAE
ncbi:hypothetical protein EWM64_g4892 [Hericium alpestre]|uniref:Uncharacterized protein n=1 Tax=Hericium alpestre TaxID=135208 RepID=A0A4Y9ZYU0_9AGAM|nr:hypothetical protein EWM64_g4892 [Hericium alpestre]